MTISITLFHGIAGWAAALLAVKALIDIAGGIAGWLGERYALELDRVQRWPAGRPVLRLRLSRRWARPGATVGMADGRQAAVLHIIRDRDATADVALVQPCDETGDYQPEWVTVDRLSPAGYGPDLCPAREDIEQGTGPACDACGGPQAEHALLSVADDGRIIHSSHFYDFDDEYYQRAAPSAAMHSIAPGTTEAAKS